MVQLSMTLSDL